MPSPIRTSSRVRTEVPSSLGKDDDETVQHDFAILFLSLSLFGRLRDLFEYPRYGCPFKEGPNYYMNVNSGLQNQAVMYIMRGSLDAKQEVFLDPNTLSKDGTVSMSSYTCEFSKDGR